MSYLRECFDSDICKCLSIVVLTVAQSPCAMPLQHTLQAHPLLDPHIKTALFEMKIFIAALICAADKTV